MSSCKLLAFLFSQPKLAIDCGPSVVLAEVDGDLCLQAQRKVRPFWMVNEPDGLGEESARKRARDTLPRRIPLRAGHLRLSTAHQDRGHRHVHIRRRRRLCSFHDCHVSDVDRIEGPDC